MYYKANRYQIWVWWGQAKKDYKKNLSYEWFLYSYISYNYNFIIFILIENIYITIIKNINLFRRGSCPKNILDILILLA